MYKSILVVAILGTLTILPFLIDNTDKDPWREGDTLVVAHDGSINRISRFSPDWKPQSHFDQYHEEIYQNQEKQRLEQLEDLLKETQNVCTNGKAASSLSLVDYMNEFIKGPCAPIVMLPGLIGTSLQVEVDCEVLRDQSPTVFENCGWSTCNSLEIWKKKPSAEYRLWIGLSTSPLSIIQTNKKDKCLGDFIELLYDPTKTDPKERYSQYPGLKVTWQGNTPETLSGAECGSQAIQEISKDPLVKSVLCDPKGYHSINDALKNMGFIPGLTMQAVPYDFRLSIAASESQAYIKNSITNMYKVSGKKVYLMGHSLGTLHSTNAMYEMSQEDKDKMVAGLLAVGGPLLGATKTFKPQFGGDDSYMLNVLLLDAGLNFYTQTKMAWSAPSIVDLYPKDTFTRFRNQPWMKDLLKRMDLDAEYLSSGNFPTTNVPLSWFPTPDKTCGASFSDRPDSCLLMMSDLAESYLKVGDKTYTALDSSVKSAVTDNIDEPQATRLLQFIEETRRQKAINVEHPGVPMIILYGAHTAGPYQFTYNKVPKDVIAQSNDFYLPDNIENIVGDGTVVASSAMAPGIKWIYEHLNGQTTKPTKLVEYCSEFSGDSSSIYDSSDYSKPRNFSSSGYVGLKCQCRQGKVKMDKCGHACMISDPILVEFVADLVLNNQPSAFQATPVSEAELKSMRDNCENLK